MLTVLVGMGRENTMRFDHPSLEVLEALVAKSAEQAALVG
jgi:hypothetical protein